MAQVTHTAGKEEEEKRDASRARILYVFSPLRLCYARAFPTEKKSDWTLKFKDDIVIPFLN